MTPHLASTIIAALDAAGLSVDLQIWLALVLRAAEPDPDLLTRSTP